MDTQWLGLSDYNKALELQNTLVEQVLSGASKGTVLGVEHPLVYTLGIRGDASRDVVSHSAAPVIKCSRGGEATFHNPGQLVIYPIFNLREFGLGAKDYVCALTKTTKAFLTEHYGINSFEGKEPGLYTDKGKIAAIGIKISKGVCCHGIAINICNDLEKAAAIRVCGVEAQPLDKCSSNSTDLSQCFQQWYRLFLRHIEPSK